MSCTLLGRVHCWSGVLASPLYAGFPRELLDATRDMAGMKNVICSSSSSSSSSSTTTTTTTVLEFEVLFVSCTIKAITR